MIVYTDLHLFGTHPIISMPLDFGPDIFYIGDIVDIKNCHYLRLEDAYRYLRQLEENAGENSVPGNHELKFGTKKYIIYNNILLTHGDYFSWSNRTINKWRGGIIQPGASWPTRAFLRFKNICIKNHPVFLSSYEIETIYSISTSIDIQCHTVIIGHKHPKRIIRKRIRKPGKPEVTIIVLPRGRHELNL